MALLKKAIAHYFLTDEQTGKPYPLLDGTVFGRNQGDHHFSEDPRMSGKHATFTTKGIEVFIEDNGSRNGVFVNGNRIPPNTATRVHPGDMIEMGNHVFCLGRTEGTPAAFSTSHKKEETNTAVLANAGSRTFKLSASPLAETTNPSVRITTNSADKPANKSMSSLKSAGLPLLKPEHESPASTSPKTTRTKVETETPLSLVEVSERSERTFAFFDGVPEHSPLYGLLTALIAIQAFMFAQGVDAFHPSTNDLIHWGANHAPLSSTEQGWRLLTATFVHSSVIQLFANALLIWQIGAALVPYVGSLGFLTLFAAAGVISSAASLVLQPGVLDLGSTHAALALCGAAVAIIVRLRESLDFGPRMTFSLSFALFLAANASAMPHASKALPLAATAFISGAVLALLIGSNLNTRMVTRVLRILGVWILTSIVAWSAKTMAPPAPVTSDELRAVLTESMPLAERYDGLMARWQRKELLSEQFTESLKTQLIPQLHALKAKTALLPLFQDVRKDAVADLILGFAKLEEAWTTRTTAIPTDDTAGLQKADELEHAAFQKLDQAARIFQEWNKQEASKNPAP